MRVGFNESDEWMKLKGTEGPEGFYNEIVVQLKQQDILCAITGGLACVQFGVAHYTEDCDLICAPNDANRLLTFLQQKTYAGATCVYRGLSAPLDERWLAGGYTAHFHWPSTIADKAFLDVFGIPPRLSSAWQIQMQGIFAGPHTVAEMKRTKRRRDWDQATALGLKMIEAGDQRGWLHLFDATTLQALLAEDQPGPQELSQRPALRLALEKSPLLSRAIQTEIDFWSHLDRIRLKVYEAAAKKYARAIRKEVKSYAGDLASQHQFLVNCAAALLPQFPLNDYGWPRIVKEAMEATSIGLDPKLLEYLPDVSIHFNNPGKPS